jgi:hypothetical protein
MRIHTNSHGLKLHVGGRKRPAPRKKRFLARYGAVPGVTLPQAPSVVDWTVAGGSPVPGLADILANDTLGDCTSAGMWHLVEAINAAAGAPITPTPTRDDAVTFYSLSTGYVSGQPATDQGGDEITVLTTACQKGLDGAGAHAPIGFFDVDPADVPAMRSIVWLFGGLYFGAELPDAYLEVAGPGYTWDVGTPNPNNGHCFVGLGASDAGIADDSWGLNGTITYAAIAELCAEANGGALYAILTKESLNRASALCPAGIDWATLLADFQAEGGVIAADGPSASVAK